MLSHLHFYTGSNVTRGMVIYSKNGYHVTTMCQHSFRHQKFDNPE